MFLVSGSIDGVTIEYKNLQRLFPSPVLELSSLPPPTLNPSYIDLINCHGIVVKEFYQPVKDETGKEKFVKKYMILPDFIVPSLDRFDLEQLISKRSDSINTKAASNQSSVRCLKLPDLLTQLPDILAIENENRDQLTSSRFGSIKTKNYAKRALIQSSGRELKKPRLFNFKPSPKLIRKKLVDPKSSVVISKLRETENDIVSSPSSSSTSSALDTIQDLSFQSPQFYGSNINRHVDLANVDNISTERKVLEIRTRNTPNDEHFIIIEGTGLISQILSIVKSTQESPV